ncbi:MAG: hypothetical protein H6876_11925, partial [Hyphomicrobiaceae bacterium]|nr:hypothetical protein [Hyphomicrobiaceae bacterium]
MTMFLRGISALVFAALFVALPSQVAAQSYAPVGPQTNVPVSTVTGGGWTECFKQTFNGNGHTLVASVLSACSGTELMMACRLTGSSTLTLLAQASKSDVTVDTGTGNTTHNANGVEWYFNDNYSWGFANGGDTVTRNSCDTQSTNANLRMCIHTHDFGVGGWRCGSATGLNNSPTYE